jgi:hypothetical protein
MEQKKRKPVSAINKSVAVGKASEYDYIDDKVDAKALERFHAPIYHLLYQYERDGYGKEILLDKTKD